MEQKMKLTKDIIDAVKKTAEITAEAYQIDASKWKTTIYKFINPSEVADAILELLVEYEKQVNDKTKKLIDEMQDKTEYKLNDNRVFIDGWNSALTRIMEKL